MKFNQPAGVGERFVAGAFDSQIGKEIPVNLPGGQVQGKILAAKVADDGQSVELDVDLAMPDGPSAAAPPSAGSFGFTDR